MSDTEMKRFFEALGSDPAMKQEAEAKSGSIADMASYAQGKGFDVTTDDLQKLAAQGKDLSEEDLDKVAGGGVGVSVGCVVCISAGT